MGKVSLDDKGGTFNREDLDFIKGHMIDVDSIMTEDDYLSLNEYRNEKESGKLTSHEELKREMGL